MDLVEWASAFIDNLDMFRRDLEKKVITGNEILCIYKAKGEHKYIIEPELKKEILEKIKKGSITLVCLNKKENLVFIINNWHDLIKNQKLKVIFVNPKLNLQWSLIPYTHNIISDPSSLKLGLKSIFESVPEV
jgi:hypothetical protein